jgi:hypothetical protein
VSRRRLLQHAATPHQALSELQSITYAAWGIARAGKTLGPTIVRYNLLPWISSGGSLEYLSIMLLMKAACNCYFVHYLNDFLETIGREGEIPKTNG